ncbi:hypothetical protein [Marinobacter nauticus]
MQPEHPYPNPFEILRFVLRSLDLKQSKKRLDGLVAQRVYDPRELDQAIQLYFSAPVEKYMGQPTAAIASKNLTRFLDRYMHDTVGKISADGVSRDTTLAILSTATFKDQVIELMQELRACLGGPQLSTWFSSQSSTVSTILDWIKHTFTGWNSYLSDLSKEQKDMISSWSRGPELPSAQSILLLGNAVSPSTTDEVDWQKIKTWLFAARAIDFVKKSSVGLQLLDDARLALWGANIHVSVASEIQHHQRMTLEKLGSEYQLIACLQHELKRTTKKQEPNLYRGIIDQARAQILASNHLISNEYWIDWHDARWHVFSGQLDEALALYKRAFSGALFRSGENQKAIIEESLVVAARLPNPDRVFLKHLKWALINFGYDIPSISRDRPSQKVSDTVEDCEKERWDASFITVFPPNGLFPGNQYDTHQSVLGPLTFKDTSAIKPDYRHPNRKLKIGETWQRVMPQLVWFSLNEDAAVCEKLIEKGAKVDVTSEAGDTPILMALEALNVTEVNEVDLVLGRLPYRTLDDRLFNLLKSIPHSAKTLNTRTQKKRLLPIISAVESGRLDVVQTVLDMGADPNSRGKTDEQTALNVCLKLIGTIKDPELAKEYQMSMPITPEALDAIRRQSHGMSGFTVEHQELALKRNTENGLFREALSLLIEARHRNILQHMTIAQMRKIAKLLIASGADPNAEHASPIRGYTPLMLAAELNERELFDAMLVAGGNIQKKYSDPKTGHTVSIAEIAREFDADEILQSLEDISVYVTIQ